MGFFQGGETLTGWQELSNADLLKRKNEVAAAAKIWQDRFKSTPSSQRGYDMGVLGVPEGTTYPGDPSLWEDRIYKTSWGKNLDLSQIDLSVPLEQWSNKPFKELYGYKEKSTLHKIAGPLTVALATAGTLGPSGAIGESINALTDMVAGGAGTAGATGAAITPGVDFLGMPAGTFATENALLASGGSAGISLASGIPEGVSLLPGAAGTVAPSIASNVAAPAAASGAGWTGLAKIAGLQVAGAGFQAWLANQGAEKAAEATESTAGLYKAASEYAADVQRESTAEAINYLREAGDKATEQLKPYYEAGLNALNQLYPMVESGPGEYEKSQQYQNLLAEGIDAIIKGSKGQSLRGSTLKEVGRFATSLASQDYQNWFNNYLAGLDPLFNIANMGFNAANQGANAGTNTGTNIANLTANLGGNLASNYLTGAEMTGNALTQAAQQRQSGYTTAANAFGNAANQVALLNYLTNNPVKYTVV